MTRAASHRTDVGITQLRMLLHAALAKQAAVRGAQNRKENTESRFIKQLPVHGRRIWEDFSEPTGCGGSPIAN